MPSCHVRSDVLLARPTSLAAGVAFDMPAYAVGRSTTCRVGLSSSMLVLMRRCDVMPG